MKILNLFVILFVVSAFHISAEETYIGTTGCGDLNNYASFEMFHGQDNNAIYSRFFDKKNACNIYVYGKHYENMPFIKVGSIFGPHEPQTIHTATNCVIKVKADTWDIIDIQNNGTMEVGDYDDYVCDFATSKLNFSSKMQLFHGEDENGKFTRFIDEQNVLTIIIRSEHCYSFPDDVLRKLPITATNAYIVFAKDDNWKIEKIWNFGFLEFE